MGEILQTLQQILDLGLTEIPRPGREQGAQVSNLDLELNPYPLSISDDPVVFDHSKRL